MKKMQHTALFRKCLAILIALLTGISFMPLLGGQAFAADKNTAPQGDGIIAVDENGDEFVVSDQEDEAIAELFGPEISGGAVKSEKADAIPLRSIEDPVTVAADSVDEATAESAIPDDIGSLGEEFGAPAPEGPDLTRGTVSTQAASLFTVTVNKATGVANIRGSLARYPGCTFESLYVDDYYAKYLGGATTINTNINMKEYSVGYHNISATVSINDEAAEVYKETFKTYIPTYIYGRPGNNPGAYQFYSKYFEYYTGSNYYGLDSSCSLYMQYRKPGKAWKTCGPMDSYKTYRKSGLTPNKKYKTRLFYAKSVSYNGRDYLFSGLSRGYVSPVKSFKTGKNKKPPIKSVTVTAKNVKKHKVRYYYYGMYLGSRTYYTYKLKVTVKMKKKPAAKGIVIAGKIAKGNKKSYSKTFGTFLSSSSPRGKKAIISVYSYQNKTWGGYSKLYKKTKKVR